MEITMTKIKKLDKILTAIRGEVLKAMEKHKPMNSAHEGFAVIQEEVDELWDEVKADRGYQKSGLDEAKQIAAMGVRYIMDLAD